MDGRQDCYLVIVFVQQADQPVFGLDGEVSDWLDIDEHALTFYGRAESPLFIVPKLNLFGRHEFEHRLQVPFLSHDLSPRSLMPFGFVVGLVSVFAAAAVAIFASLHPISVGCF